MRVNKPDMLMLVKMMLDITLIPEGSYCYQNTVTMSIFPKDLFQ